MGVAEDRPGRGRELLVAGLLKALVNLAALVLAGRLPGDLADLVIAADRTPDSIGPAHCLKVG
jgi:hypothetical protein